MENKIIIVVICLSAVLGNNLVCNGDFQDPAMNSTNSCSWFFFFDSTTIKAMEVNSDPNCWYRYPPGNIQFQKQVYVENIQNTQNVELSDFINIKYSLCQNILLQINYNYSLSLNVARPKQVASATAYIYLNNMLFMSGTCSNFKSSIKISQNFTATVSNYELCINGSVVNTSTTSWYNDDYSPLIDNVTLIDISTPVADILINSSIASPPQPTNSTTNSTINQTVNSTTNPIPSIFNSSNLFNSSSDVNNNYFTVEVEVFIYLIMTTNDQEGYIQLNTRDPMSLQLFNVIKHQGALYIENQLQRQITYTYLQRGYARIRVYSQRSYDLKTISITLPNSIQTANTKMKVTLFINGRPVYLYVLSPNLMTGLNSIQPYSTAIINGITKSYTFMKTFFFSYFVVNIINFYTLTLMYNFLALPAQPNFSHNALEKLAQLFYVKNSLLSNVEKIVRNSNFQSVLEFKQFVNRTQQRERVDNFYRQYLWFGGMGVSYSFLYNNFQNFIILTLTILKLLLLSLILRLFPKLSKKLNGDFINFGQICLIQFICLAPMMIISGTSVCTNSGYYCYNQKINFVMHASIHVFVLFSPALLYLNLSFFNTKHKKIQKKFEKQKIKSKKPQVDLMLIQNLQEHKKEKQHIFRCFQYFLTIFIPLLSAFKSETAFFVVISIILACLLYLLFKYFFHFSLKQRIFKVSMLFIFFIHHFSFLLLFVSEKMSNQYMNKFMQICKIIGVLTIFTVVCGGCIQIIDFILRIAIFIGKIIYKLLRNSQVQKKVKQENIVSLKKNLGSRQSTSNVLIKQKASQNELSYISVQLAEEKEKKVFLKKFNNHNIKGSPLPIKVSIKLMQKYKNINKNNQIKKDDLKDKNQSKKLKRIEKNGQKRIDSLNKKTKSKFAYL